MKKFLLILVSLILWLGFISASRAAELISSGDLVERSKFYDGQTILFRGEVIGDIMFRGERAWLNVNDDGYSAGSRKLSGYNSGQSVWCRSADAKEINICGNYFHVGDNIEVLGVFYRACPEHGGDMDIHAEQITVIEPGRSIDYPVEAGKLILLAALFLALAVLLVMKKLSRS